MKPCILIFGGTREASYLSSCLVGRGRWCVVTSLLGVTSRTRTTIAGEVCVGSFGGVEGLVCYLEGRGVCCVIDATHIFASRISRNIVEACRVTGTPFLRLERRCWERTSEDLWIEVDTIEQVLESLPLVRVEGRERVFLSIGSRYLDRFRGREDLSLVVRSFTVPVIGVGEDIIVLEGRSETTRREERCLLLEYGVDVIVSRNSGGSTMYGKILAARDLRVPIIMLCRPRECLGGLVVEDVEDVLRWVESMGV